MVLDTVASPNSRRNYGKALNDLFRFAAGQPLSRELLMEWRTKMEGTFAFDDQRSPVCRAQNGP